MVRLILFTDRRQASRPLVDVVGAAVDGGARMVVLREKDLPDGARAALAAQLHAVLAAAGGRLLCAGRLPGPDGVDRAAGGHVAAAGVYPAAAGVHLAAAQELSAPRPGGLVGRSCHDATELAQAADQGVDYATVSPVFASASKPGYGPALGLGALRELCAATALPVYALGGVDTPERASRCLAAGAAGVAVMGAVMRAADPARATAELLAALADEIVVSSYPHRGTGRPRSVAVEP